MRNGDWRYGIRGFEFHRLSSVSFQIDVTAESPPTIGVLAFFPLAEIAHAHTCTCTVVQKYLDAFPISSNAKSLIKFSSHPFLVLSQLVNKSSYGCLFIQESRIMKLFNLIHTYILRALYIKNSTKVTCVCTYNILSHVRQEFTLHRIRWFSCFHRCILFKTVKLFPRDGGVKELVSRFIRSSDLSGTTYPEEMTFEWNYPRVSFGPWNRLTFILTSLLAILPTFRLTRSQRARTPVKYHFTC